MRFVRPPKHAQKPLPSIMSKEHHPESNPATENSSPARRRIAPEGADKPRSGARVFAMMLLIALITLPFTLAANDPGHDSLYVLLTGDSIVTGNINVSGDLNASDLRFARILYGSQLDIRANGSIYTPSSRPALQTDSSDIYLDAMGNLYINTLAGTSGIIQVGPRTGSGITLNVSGTIYEQNVRVCLSNGTNCLTGENDGNISRVIAGDGISISNEYGPTVTVSTSASTCSAGQYSYWDGNSWECRADEGASGTAGGWDNSTEGIVQLINMADDLNVSNTLWVDAGTGRVGIGTNNPATDLHISGTANITDQLMLPSGSFTTPSLVFTGGESDTTAIGFYKTGTEGNTALAIRRFNTNISAFSVYGSWNNLQLSSSTGLVWSSTGQIGASAQSDVGFARTGTNSISLVNGSNTATGYGNLTLQNLYSQGQIGIGTTNPSTDLEVIGTINATDIQIGNTQLCQADGTNCPAGASAPSTGLTNQSVADGDIVQTNTGANVTLGSSTLYVDNTNERIGIGTTNPKYELDVTGTINSTIDYTQTTIYYAGQSGYQLTTTPLIYRRSDNKDLMITAGGGASFGDIVFYTNNGGTQLVIDNNTGYIGIGTSTPGQALHVIGNINTTGTINATDFCLDDGSGCLSTTGGGGSRWTAGSGTLYNDTATAVGIGTNTPHSLLEIQSSTGAARIIVNETSGTETERYLLDLYNNGITTIRKTDTSGDGSTWESKVTAGNYILTKFGTGGPELTISDRTGGIGSPTLDIDGNIQATTALIDSTANPALQIGDGSTGYLRIGNSNIYDAVGDLTLDSDSGEIYIPDELGIGTNSPAHALDIYGADETTLRIGASGTRQNSNIILNNSDREMGLRITGHNPPRLTIWDKTGSTTPLEIQSGAPSNTLFIESTGEIGIGTTSPSHELHVQGSIVANGSDEGYYVGNSAGAIYKSLYVDTSNTEGLGTNGLFLATSGGSEDLRFKTGGSVKVSVLDGGNVGIGTTTPHKRLEILADAPAILLNDTTSGRWTVAIKAPDLQFSDIDSGTTPVTFESGSSSNALYLDSTGELMIGTSSSGTNTEGLGDLFVSDELEVDGQAYFDSATNPAVYVSNVARITNLAVGMAWDEGQSGGEIQVGSRYYMAIQDGTARINEYMNSYYNGSNHVFASAEDAWREYWHTNARIWYAAPCESCSAGDIISWTTGFALLDTGEVTIGTTTSGTNTDGAGDLYVLNDLEVDGNFYGSGADIAEVIPNETTMSPGEVVVISETIMGVALSSKPFDSKVAGVVTTDPAIILGSNDEGSPIAISGRVPVKVNIENGPIDNGDYLVSSSTPGEAMGCKVRELDLTAPEEKRWQTLKDNDRCRNSAFAKAMEPADSAGLITGLVLLN